MCMRDQLMKVYQLGTIKNELLETEDVVWGRHCGRFRGAEKIPIVRTMYLEEDKLFNIYKFIREISIKINSVV